MNKAVGLIFLMLVTPTITSGQFLHFDSTITFNGERFRIQQIQLEKHMTLLKISKGKNIILADTLDFFADIEIVDFDRNKAPDVRITFMGNIDRQSLYLFNDSRNGFNKVKDFEKFPAAKAVKGGCGFYYSYHRSGCADDYWTSDLFKIDDFKVVQVGQIFGNGCEEPRQVNVYKISQNKKELLETLPYKLVEASKDYKWGFIDNYWAKNNGRFKQTCN